MSDNLTITNGYMPRLQQRGGRRGAAAVFDASAQRSARIVLSEWPCLASVHAASTLARVVLIC